MRVILITETYPPDIGGLAVSAARLARGMVEAGLDVHVLAPGEKLLPGQQRHRMSSGVRVHRVGIARRTDDTLMAWFEALKVLHSDHPFDLIQGHFITHAGFVAAYSGRFLGVPSLVSARGNDLDRAIFDPGKAAHILYALTHASAVTVNTRELIRKANALAPASTVEYIPNGVDTSLFAPGRRDNALAYFLPTVGDMPVIGFVGEARAKKGLATLLLAFRIVAQQRPVSLMLVGRVRKGQDRETLNVFQKQNPSLPLVEVGWMAQHEMPDFYRLCDVVLMPSLRDGLPNALLEAMACGCAVVGTEVGGIADVLRHEENGLVVVPGSADALAVAINRLLDDAELRNRLGTHARADVVRTHPLEQERERYLALYRRLTESSS